MGDRGEVIAGLKGAKAFFEARADMAVGDGKMLLLSWAKALGDAIELLEETVPLDKLCVCLEKNNMNIPCESCPHLSNQLCTAVGDMFKPCPRSADDWRVAITKWMTES